MHSSLRAKQSSLLPREQSGLLRRFAPRNDERAANPPPSRLGLEAIGGGTIAITILRDGAPWL
jgi:hypothetical protein